jgi:hypothetical protein
MSEVTPESRTAVIILVHGSWQDQVGTQMTARVRMENRSASGARLRTKRRIVPGDESARAVVLEAAGVAIEEVLRDAKVRQEPIDA